LFSSRVQKKVRAAPAGTASSTRGDVVQDLDEIDLSSAAQSAESMWMYVVDEQSCGPVSESELQSLLSQGLVPTDSLVWTKGWASWLPACDVPVFKPFKDQSATAPTIKNSQEASQVSAEGNKGFATTSLTFGIIGLMLLFVAVLAAVLRVPLALSYSQSAEVLGIMKWVSGILAIPPAILAIIFGHVTRNAKLTPDATIPGGTRAMIGLILGYVTLSPMILGGIAILAVILAAG